LVSPDGTAAVNTVMAVTVSAIWLYLLLGRGYFWRAMQRDDAQADGVLPTVWPDVVAVVPARDEAEVIGRTMASLVAQDYAGSFTVILVDDQSRDGTAARAIAAAISAGAEDRLAMLDGLPLSPGWTGKLWSMQQGVAAALGR